MNVLLWDFDATLGFRRGGWSGVLAEVLLDEGIKVGPERIRPLIGKGFPWNYPERIRKPPETADAWWANLEVLFQSAFAEVAQLSPVRAAECARRVRGKYLRPEPWELFSDTIPALTALTDAGWHHIVLSNHVPELRMIVERLGIAQWFEQILTSAELGIEKPNPAAFLRAMALLPQARHWVMVGDNLNADIRGAEAVGVPAVLVRTPTTETIRHCDDLNQLVTLLAKAD